MALTKVTGQVIKNTTDVTVGVLTVTNTLAVGGTVSIGGTLTYEDVTNVDAVGLITARNGIVVGSGITLSKDGDIFATGVSTVTTLKVGSGVTVSSDGDIFATGVTTSTTFVGNLTGTASANAVLTGSTDNTIVTVTGANAIQGESTLTYDGTYLDIGGGVTRFTKQGSYNSLEIGHGQNSNQYAFIDLIGDTTYTDYGLRIIRGNNGANSQSDIVHRGTGNLNLQTSDAASITFETNGGNERLRIDSNGMIGIGGVTPKTQNTFDAIEFGKTGFLGSQTGARTVEMVSNAYYNSGWKYKENDVASQYYQYQGYHAFTTAASGSADAAVTFSEALRIDAYGRVLIGGTSAIIGSSSEFNEIVLTGKTRGAGITLQDVDANTRFQIRTDDAGGDPMTLMNASTNHPIAIRTNNTERLRIDSAGRILIGTTTAVGSNTPNLQVLAQTPTSGFENHIYLEGNETSGAADTGATIGFGGHDGQTARNWAQIAGFKSNGTSGNTSSFLSFRTRRSGVAGINEMWKITAMGSLLARDSKESAIGREYTNGSVPAGQTRDYTDNSRLNYNSIGGNGGGHITCLSVSSFDQNPSGAMIVAGVHGQGFNTYDTIVSNFDSGISVTFSGGTVTIQNTSSETIYYSINVIHMGTGNTTYLGR